MVVAHPAGDVRTRPEPFHPALISRPGGFAGFRLRPRKPLTCDDARWRTCLVLGLLADGMTHTELLADYPHLTEEDVRACLGYGSLLASGRFIDVA